MASEQKSLKIGLGEAGNKVIVIFFAGNTAWGGLTAAALPPTHTLTQMPKILTLVATTPKRLGALPVVIITNRWTLNGLSLCISLIKFGVISDDSHQKEKGWEW